jgi:drug/metabolite transporter (DMT)-like permease
VDGSRYRLGVGQYAARHLFFALIGTAFANAVWYQLPRFDDVGRLTMFFFLVPVFGLAIGALAFGESISLREGSRVLVVLAGIGAIVWEARHKP